MDIAFPQYGFINRSYTYDAADNLLRCDSPGSQTQWVYNKNNQITQYHQDRHTEHYRYNRGLGVQHWQDNSHHKGYHYSPSGQLTQTQHSQQVSIHYRYDDNGRLLEKLTERNGFRTTQQRYIWNSEDQLIIVTADTPNSPASAPQPSHLEWALVSMPICQGDIVHFLVGRLV